METSEKIDNLVAELGDWRGQRVAHLRRLIGEAAPELSEEWKWNTPTWSYKGNVLAVGVFKEHVKINFFKGPALDDAHGLFNAGLDAKTMRSIDIHEGDTIDEAALSELIRAAVALNGARK